MLSKLFSVFRTTAFLIALCVALVTTTISMGVWAVGLTTQVATLTAGATAAALAKRTAVASAVAKTRARMLVRQKRAVAGAVANTRAKVKAREKAKARLRRVMVAVPIAGLAAAAAFERYDYLEWKEDNPQGDVNAYGCEVARTAGEVVDEVLQELPEAVRPSPKTLLSRLPECAAPPVPVAKLRGTNGGL